MADIPISPMGRCIVVVEGMCDAPKAGKPVENPSDPPNPPTFNVAYMGGRAWVRFKDATQAGKVRGGEMVRVECDYITTKTGSFAGAGVITHVNGKAV